MVKNLWMPKFDVINPDNPNHVRAWHNAMDDIRIEVDANTLKSEFIQWAKDNDASNVVHFESLPAYHFGTVGKYAFAVNRGAVAPNSTANWVKDYASKLLRERVESDPAVAEPEDERVSPRAKRVNEYVNLYSFIDTVLAKHSTDGEKIEEMVRDKLNKSAPNRAILKKLYVHYKENMSDSFAEKDNPLVEKMIAPLVLVVNMLAAATGNAKVARYKGVKVDRKAAKAAENVTYKVMDSGLNLASIPPSQIPGTNAVVIYNTKSRKAMLYKAKDGEVLGIKGTKIIGFDELTTVAKTLRKPKEVLPMLRNAINAKRIDIVFGYVNGKNHKANGKINKDMVILKVFK